MTFNPNKNKKKFFLSFLRGVFSFSLHSKSLCFLWKCCSGPESGTCIPHSLHICLPFIWTILDVTTSDSGRPLSPGSLDEDSVSVRGNCFSELSLCSPADALSCWSEAPVCSIAALACWSLPPTCSTSALVCCSELPACSIAELGS